MKNHYKVLGVAEDATQGEITKAYRRLARKYHPDLSKETDAEARFKEVQAAYDVLGDEETRAEYDTLSQEVFDETFDGARALVMFLIRASLPTALEQAAIDWPVRMIAMVRHELEKAQDLLNSRAREVQDLIEGLKKQKNKVRRKRGGPNLFDRTIDLEIEKAQTFLDGQPRRLEEVSKAKRLLDDYEEGANIEFRKARLLK